MDESEELILRFCEIVGCDPEQAAMYMDMSGGNLDLAVSLYLDNSAPENGHSDSVQDISNEVEELTDSDVEETGDIRRVYDSQGRHY